MSPSCPAARAGDLTLPGRRPEPVGIVIAHSHGPMYMYRASCPSVCMQVSEKAKHACSVPAACRKPCSSAPPARARRPPAAAQAPSPVATSAFASVTAAAQPGAVSAAGSGPAAPSPGTLPDPPDRLSARSRCVAPHIVAHSAHRRPRPPAPPDTSQAPRDGLTAPSVGLLGFLVPVKVA